MLSIRNTRIGRIAIAEEGGALTSLYFDTDPNFPKADGLESPLLARAFEQLEEYLSGKRKIFELPIAPAGTPFMQAVWQALTLIPWGETRSYQQIAETVGNPKACRAVGMANNRNPLPIFIPCHRVIGKDGNPVGYGGGLSLKNYLLELEHT